MHGKSFQAVIVVLAFTVPLLTGTAFAQQPSQQGISLKFTQQPWDATAGCPAAYTVEVISQGGFQGAVNLTVVDPPDKVNAVFFPNLVEVPPNGESSSYLSVMVLPDTPQGMTELTVKGESLPNGEVSVTSLLTFNVGPPCGKQPRTAVTATVATTIMATTTVTSTFTQPMEPPSDIGDGLVVTTTVMQQVSDVTLPLTALTVGVALIVAAAIILRGRRRQQE